MACALLIAAAPAGIGQLLRHWGPALVDDWAPGSRVDIQTGWMRSAAHVDLSENQRMDLALRHLPLFPPRLLSARGWLEIPDSTQPAAVSGHLGLLGAGRIHASHPELVVDHPGTTRLNDFRLDMATRLSGNHLAMTASRLQVTDDSGNRLDVGDWSFDLEWHQDDKGLHFVMQTQGRQDGAVPSRAVVKGHNLAVEPTARLVEFWGQATEAAPGSRQETMARIGLLDAWQEIRTGDLVLELEELSLDGAFSLAGRWQSADGRFGGEVGGGGSRQALLAWMTPIAALSMEIAPDQGPELTGSILEALKDQGWLRRKNGEMEFRYPADPDDVPVSPPDPGGQ